MKIIQLEIENIKNISAAIINPQGHSITISGENGSGKTAAIDAFWMALDNAHAKKENPDPIKHGESTAKVTVNLGKYIVTRTWTKAGTYLKITNAEGAVFESPAAMLSSLIGDLSFNPQTFTNMAAKEQLNTLLDMFGMSTTIQTLNLKRKDLYDHKTDVTKTINMLKGQKDGITVPDGVPDEEKSTTEIMAEYQAASNQVLDNDAIRHELAVAELKVKANYSDIAETKATLEKEEQDLLISESIVAELQAKEELLVDPDLEKIKCSADDIDVINQNVRTKQKLTKITTELNQLILDRKNLISSIGDIDSEKSEYMQSISMPIPGLSFDEKGVLYNNTQLQNCSTAEQLKVSVAIAMSLNPTLRVIRITDGSLLDETNLKIIEDMVKAKDFQVWIEKVDKSGKLGIYIKEGKIVTDNQIYTKRSATEPPAPTLN